MSWSAVEPFVRPSNEPKVSARISLTRGRARLFVHIPAAIADLLASDFVTVEVGKGEHKGLLRLTGDPSGRHNLTQIMKGARRLMLNAMAGLPQEDCPNEPCPIVEKSAGEIIIRLPIAEWETAISKARIVEPVAPVAMPARRPETPLPPAASVSLIDNRVDAAVYLKKKGIIVVDRGNGRYEIDGAPATIDDLVAEVNAARRKAGLGPLTAEQLK